MVEAGKVYVPSEGIVVREIEGEFIIIPIAAGIADMEEDIFSLNETGKAIWERLDGKQTLEQIVDLLSLEFEGDRSLLLEDVLGFVDELLRRKMLVEC